MYVYIHGLESEPPCRAFSGRAASCQYPRQLAQEMFEAEDHATGSTQTPRDNRPVPAAHQTEHIWGNGARKHFWGTEHIPLKGTKDLMNPFGPA
jgi:hypothetical protein